LGVSPNTSRSMTIRRRELKLLTVPSKQIFGHYFNSQ